MSGPGGIRTLVQTRNQPAFYMLICLYFFDSTQDGSHQSRTYFLNFICNTEPFTDYLRYSCTTLSVSFEATAPGDVSFQLP